jgi:hypothetical protein
MANGKKVILPKHLLEQHFTNIEERIKQQQDYYGPYIIQILDLAKILHSQLGRGAIGIAWPAPPFLFLVSNLFAKASYLREDDLRAQGATSEYAIMQMLEQYDPEHQAIVAFFNRSGLPDIHQISISPNTGVRFGPF